MKEPVGALHDPSTVGFLPMSRAQSVVVVVLVCASLALAYRTFALERRVSELVPAVEARRAARAQSVKARVAQDPRRLDKSEAAVEALRQDVDSASERIGAKVDRADLDQRMSDDRILAIVEGERKRIDEIQLAQHRKLWLEIRERAAADFAERHALAPAAAQEIRRLLLDEVESMVVILRSDDAQREPEQAISDWKAMVEETNRKAHRVLDAEASAHWDEAHAREWRVYVPWLPAGI